MGTWPAGPRREPALAFAPRPVRARAPSPARGTAAHCWRGPRPGGAICMRSSHKGSRSGTRPPSPARPALLAARRRECLVPAPAPPLRVNGRAPPPSAALCVSARPAGPAGDVPARPAAPPPAPLAHANQPGSASGRAAWPGAPRGPGQDPLMCPCGREAPSPCQHPLPTPPARSPLSVRKARPSGAPAPAPPSSPPHPSPSPRGWVQTPLLQEAALDPSFPPPPASPRSQAEGRPVRARPGRPPPPVSVREGVSDIWNPQTGHISKETLQTR